MKKCILLQCLLVLTVVANAAEPKSPSLVFHGIGDFTIKGVEFGFSKMDVAKGDDLEEYVAGLRISTKEKVTINSITFGISTAECSGVTGGSCSKTSKNDKFVYSEKQDGEYEIQIRPLYSGGGSTELCYKAIEVKIFSISYSKNGKEHTVGTETEADCQSWFQNFRKKQKSSK